MQKLPKGFIIDKNSVIYLEHVSSMESYVYADGSKRRALQDVSLMAHNSQAIAIVGDEPFELQLISEIIGNMKPYEDGKCSLVGLGMMRTKRKILSQLYYVNNQKLIYYHMQGISWLMFASKRIMSNDIDRQIVWLQRLMALGLESLCFKYVRDMTEAERLILLILLTLDMEAILIVVDSSHMRIEKSMFKSYKLLFEQLTKLGKTIAFSTTQCDWAQECATDIAFLLEGRIDYFGCKSDIYKYLDKRLYIVKTKDNTAMVEYISSVYTDLRCEINNGQINIYGEKETAPTPYEVQALIDTAGIELMEFRVSQYSVDEAMKGALRHDL